MHYDFSQVEDTQSFVSIPEGAYECRIAEVREGLSRDGSVRWSFRLEVLRGEYAGRTAGWDALTWSERGISRVKRALACFGLDVRGEIDIEPADLVGLAARVTFECEEREDPATGRRIARLRVPYAGYAPLDPAVLEAAAAFGNGSGYDGKSGPSGGARADRDEGRVSVAPLAEFVGSGEAADASRAKAVAEGPDASDDDDYGDPLDVDGGAGR